MKFLFDFRFGPVRCVRAPVKVAAVLQGEADLIHLLRAETAGGIFQRPAARKGVILPIGALGVELIVGGLAGQAVDPDGGNGLGVEVVEGDGVQPGRRGARRSSWSSRRRSG